MSENKKNQVEYVVDGEYTYPKTKGEMEEEKALKTIKTFFKRVFAGILLAIIPYFLLRRHIADLPMAFLIGWQISFGVSFLMKWNKEDFKTTTGYLCSMLLALGMPIISVIIMIVTWDSYQLIMAPGASCIFWFVVILFNNSMLTEEASKISGSK